MDELADGGFPFRGALLAIKVLGNDYFCGEQRPRFRDFDVFLLEDDLPGVVGDFGNPAFPLELIKRTGFGIAEDALDFEGLSRGGVIPPGGGRATAHLL